MAGEKVRWQLHKNVASNTEQALAATPHKAPTIRPLPPIMKTIQVRRTRHARHCWRSKDELISDVLLWTPTYGQAKAGRPAWTYIQQICEDTGCSPEDLPEAMKEREKWQERVRDICASGMTWLISKEGDQKASFSIPTIPRCRGGCYSFPWIAPLYPWYIPYIAEC